jgi:hypothetical protein
MAFINKPVLVNDFQNYPRDFSSISDHPKGGNSEKQEKSIRSVPSRINF